MNFLQAEEALKKSESDSQIIESEFEKVKVNLRKPIEARASRSNSTLFALLTHFLPRKRDSSKSILCHTQMRPRSSTQSFSLYFEK